MCAGVFIPLRRTLTQRRCSMPAKKKQGYSARLDERLGQTRGKQAGKKMSAAGRRKVSKATRKPKGTYGFKAKKK